MLCIILVSMYLHCYSESTYVLLFPLHLSICSILLKIIIMSVSMETLATAISLARLLTLATGSSVHFLPKMLINFMKMKAIFTPKNSTENVD